MKTRCFKQTQSHDEGCLPVVRLARARKAHKDASLLAKATCMQCTYNTVFRSQQKNHNVLTCKVYCSCRRISQSRHRNLNPNLFPRSQVNNPTRVNLNTGCLVRHTRAETLPWVAEPNSFIYYCVQVCCIRKIGCLQGYESGADRINREGWVARVGL